MMAPLLPLLFVSLGAGVLLGYWLGARSTYVEVEALRKRVDELRQTIIESEDDNWWRLGNDRPV